ALRLDQRRPLRNPYGPRVLGEIASDAEGRFSFTRVPAWTVTPVGLDTVEPGKNELGDVTASAPGYAGARKTVHVAKEGETMEVELACWPAGAIRGRVVDGAADPIADALVWPAQETLDAVGLSVRTAADGTYEIPAVAA